ncbi:uncharacterized protein LACBIDRAFT_331870 [Laccaria bicolor S238N-H82]|uniref:Predicted protein n=1 Tax=Laccaria bicolor (strain S238N-H82 / ATCC MYA-4686) TaxID=486041 RepID=B0DQU2_LACBS|nr:uncharacterized protein LACBIDRAFT_331870 [Laccaria bicolor S238N-H82]EDR03089.1 predicted protein [Laccaria bicolor S238N-H82]|eukprot:XP_001886230.1 predicted protein [Laccaria bicolor S238N-H82]
MRKCRCKDAGVRAMSGYATERRQFTWRSWERLTRRRLYIVNEADSHRNIISGSAAPFPRSQMTVAPGIIIYSMHGHVVKLAEAEKASAEKAGAKATMYQFVSLSYGFYRSDYGSGRGGILVGVGVPWVSPLGVDPGQSPNYFFVLPSTPSPYLGAFLTRLMQCFDRPVLENRHYREYFRWAMPLFVKIRLLFGEGFYSS